MFLARNRWLLLWAVAALVLLFWLLSSTPPLPPSAAPTSPWPPVSHHSEIPYIGQIAADLAPWQNTRISRAMLDDALASLGPPHGVRVHIRSNRVYVSFDTDAQVDWYLELGRYRRSELMLLTLIKWSCYEVLPDADLVLSFRDAIFFNNTAASKDSAVPLPLFMFQKHSHQPGILVPYYSHLPNTVAEMESKVVAHPWNTKKEKIFWRGSTTGGVSDEADADKVAPYTKENWRSRPRSALLARCHEPELRAMCNVGFTSYKQTTWGAFWEMAPRYGWRFTGTWDTHFSHKYVASIDGNGACSGRFEHTTIGNSLVFKTKSDSIEFYYAGLEAGRHHLALEPDMSNLAEQLQWAKTHDTEAEAMATASRQFGLRYLANSAIAVYVRHLLSEYAKLLSYDLKPVKALGPRVLSIFPGRPFEMEEAACANPVYMAEQTLLGDETRDRRYKHAYIVRDPRAYTTKTATTWPPNALRTEKPIPAN